MNSNVSTETDLQAKSHEATTASFIRRFIQPAISSSAAPMTCETSVALNRGTGRLTLQYSFENGEVVYGKFYTDGLGRHSAAVLESLWRSGLGDNGVHRVSRPLKFFPEHNLLLTKAVPGVPMMSFVGDDSPEVRNYYRGAAQWLLRLHRAPVREGVPNSLWDSMKLTRVLRRITKAAARAPHARKQLIGMVGALCAKGQESSGRQRLVQTHGRYHIEHVYVHDGMVTLIDFDRSAPADPAKDLAEFVIILRNRTFKRTGNMEAADIATQIFLEEYLSELPENAENLSVHWGAFLFLNLFHYVKKHGSEAAPEFQQRMDYYLTEFDAVLAEKWNV